MAGYPEREPFFFAKVSRLMIQHNVGQEIGPEACYLISVVAAEEDRNRYQGPVEFYNNHLMPILGIGTPQRLIRIRNKAIESGWLQYQPGRRFGPGSYYVTIPESVSSCGPRGHQSQVNSGSVPSRLTKSTPETSTETERQRETFILPNTHNPDPKGSLFTREADESESFDEFSPSESLASHTRDPLTFEAEMVAQWNATPGVVRRRNNALSARLRSMLRERLADPTWHNLWLDALKKFPLPGWPGENLPTLEFTLKEDSVDKILDGNYDRTNPNRNGTRSATNQKGPGQTYQPNARDLDARHGTF